MGSPAEHTAFIRVIAPGRIRTLVFAHALRRRFKALGLDPMLVQYVPSTWSSGCLNEVVVDARLSISLWQSISSWCAEHFFELYVHEVITGQLEKFMISGVTGEERYEKTVAP